ncbi:RNA polymerase sigma factor [Sinanaerobacter sp. ZZT-01]|uniref:RNA polymerase sigma factor n=1 Tax=Sinanaerobacter sp. ZZT-01 TaxID=3111540 RepID=UPI002D779804|nr:RNA polymerase sigma factor [Sinanaerobacter sp. ZZT-01]WRR92369.1 RNA polymerase sigma factor [Sinanaerobacter sp. ZZT-01]
MSINIQEQYDKIYRYCYYKVRNTGLAEDLTQETFLRYFTQSSYMERGKMLAYLYTIARNLCIDSFRKILPERLNDDIPDMDCFGKLELSIALRQALATLPEQDQELLLFRLPTSFRLERLLPSWEFPALLFTEGQIPQ